MYSNEQRRLKAAEDNAEKKVARERELLMLLLMLA